MVEINTSAVENNNALAGLVVYSILPFFGGFFSLQVNRPSGL